jgi:N-carbamoylputrescine amidase
MTEVTVAATQMACSWDREANLDQAESLVREAAGRGAGIVLIQELFETPYFCIDQKMELFALARPFEDHPTLARMSALAAELEVVLPVSFFERANNAHFNALAIIDADGRVWNTRHGAIGAGICWDQWFPEAARVMALRGAEILFYPTAIGSEPGNPAIESKDHWQRAMQGHAAANFMPVVASNRIGHEAGEAGAIDFYGSSFIADPTGAKVAEAGRGEREVITASFDLEEIRLRRAAWGLFRDRRPDLYGPLASLDGGDGPAV